MIDRNDVEQQKVVWEQAKNGVTQKMSALEEEKNLLIRQLLTVEGAIQACTIILNMDVQAAPPPDLEEMCRRCNDDDLDEVDEPGYCEPLDSDGPRRDES